MEETTRRKTIRMLFWVTSRMTNTAMNRIEMTTVEVQQRTTR